jgi:lipid II:glycine glycyltransferase (peptidoglycan interpeptide bridge formation enzyme)
MLRNWQMFGGKQSFNRAAVYIDLTRADLLGSYQTRTRTAVRKAVKNGLRVEWRMGVENVDWFMTFYYQTMQAIGAEAFYFFPRAYFCKLLEWNAARIAVCLRDKEIVGAAIILQGPTVAEYHLSAASLEGKRLGATNLILHEAALAATAAGCSSFYLGGGTNTAPDNPLLFFKTGFSENRTEFRIGSFVHDQVGYSLLREEYQDAFQANPNRVLFYR